MRGTFVWIAVAVAACSSESARAPGPADAAAPAATTCPAGYADCDGDAHTVCETHLTSSTTSCGACGNVCPAPSPREVPVCLGGRCDFVCAAGFADCDHDHANGCEATADKCTVTTLATVDAPGGLAIDDAYVYFANKGTPPGFVDGAIYKVAKTGGAPIALATGQNRPVSIVVGSGRVFWTNSGGGQADGSIAAVDASGGPVKVLATGLTRPTTPILSDTRIFFTTNDAPNGTITSLRQDGTDRQVVVTGVVAPTDLEIAGDVLVWSARGSASDSSDAVVERVNVDGTQRMQLAVGIPRPNYALGLTSDSVYVGSFADGSIRKVALLPASQPPPPPPAPRYTGLVDPQEIHVDGTTLYVTTGSAGKVVAIPMDVGPQTVVASGQSYPSYLVLDADFLYWTDGDLSGTAAIKKTRKPR